MKILFVSHDASRTGAPLLLLRLMREIAKFDRIQIFTLLRTGGPLQNDFSKLGPVYIWDSPPHKKFFNNVFGKLLRGFSLEHTPRRVRKNVQFFKTYSTVDVIFSNTITNGGLLRQLPLTGKRLFCYFHELDVIARTMGEKADIFFQATNAESIFVPALAVKDFLVSKYQFPDRKIEILKYIIDSEDCTDKSQRFSNEISTDRFLIGLCGTLHWRKGSDLLALLGQSLIINHQQTDIHFVWIGADRSSLDFHILESDLNKLGIREYFTFVEVQEKIYQYLVQLNVFALLSREDAFPLAVLEAATCGVPTVCFKQAGGITEFVLPDAGIAVDYLDIDAMSDAILSLKNDKILRNQLGDAAKQRVREFTDPESIAGQLIKIFLDS